MFFHFLRTFQLLHIKFFAYVLGNTLSATSLEKPFHSISPSAESHFQVFWSSFFFGGGGGGWWRGGGVCISISWKLHHFVLRNFVLEFFVLLWGPISLSWEGKGGGGVCMISGPILSIYLPVYLSHCICEKLELQVSNHIKGIVFEVKCKLRVNHKS